MRSIRSLPLSRKTGLLIIGATFGLSRGIYYWLGVRFNAEPLLHFWQVIDPALLRDAPWQSLFYLRTQLPGFNLYLATIMHLFPQHSVAAFHATYLAMGLLLGTCLFLLLDRLRVNRLLAVFITVTYVISPITLLYENWLFYEYPLALLFCVAALFLHRYASSNDRSDGIAFFTSLAFIALFRVIYHLIWFGTLVALMLYAIPRCRRRTALCAAAPATLLCLVYLKSLLLFGLWVPGSDVYGGINVAFLAKGELSRGVLANMVAEKEISPILLHDFSFEDEDLVHVIPVPPRTRIGILDERVKSTGRINMDSFWMAAVGRQLRQDGLVILRSHPSAVFTTVRGNIKRYFLPADTGWPFGGTPNPNQQVLAPLLKPFDLVMSGKLPAHNYAFVSYLMTLLLLWFGFRRSARWLTRMIREPKGNALDLTIVFAFANIAYLTSVIILYDFTDQNRILFEVFPLFAVLLGSLTVLVMRRSRRSHVSMDRGRARENSSIPHE